MSGTGFTMNNIDTPIPKSTEYKLLTPSKRRSYTKDGVVKSIEFNNS